MGLTSIAPAPLTPIVCTSTTRPVSPSAGQLIYETDTFRTLQYTTVTTGWQQPWQQPWGLIGKAQATASQAAITAEVDVTSLSVTWTPVANRIYRTSMILPVNQQSAIAGMAQALIANGSNVGIQICNQSLAASTYEPILVWVYETGLTAVSTTRKGRLSVSAGTITVAPSTTYPAQIVVEDIGPNGNPL